MSQIMPSPETVNTRQFCAAVKARFAKAVSSPKPAWWAGGIFPTITLPRAAFRLSICLSTLSQ
jgi:hypothetical protein